MSDVDCRRIVDIVVDVLGIVVSVEDVLVDRQGSVVVLAAYTSLHDTWGVVMMMECNYTKPIMTTITMIAIILEFSRHYWLQVYPPTTHRSLALCRRQPSRLYGAVSVCTGLLVSIRGC